MHILQNCIILVIVLSCFESASGIWSDAQSNGFQLQTDTFSWDQVVLLFISWGALILVWITGGLPLSFDVPLDKFTGLNNDDKIKFN